MGKIVNGTFELRNVGDRSLTYSIRASCGCSDLSPREGQIPPWGSQEVNVGIRLQTVGERKSVRLTITSNDPTQPEATYTVLAECPALAIATPKSVDFGQVKKGEVREATVDVIVHEKLSFAELEKIVPKLSDDSFRCTIRPEKTEPGHLTVWMANKETLPYGMTRSGFKTA